MFGRFPKPKKAPDRPTVSRPGILWALFGLHGRIGRAPYIFGQLFMLSLLAVIVALIVNTPQEHPRFAFWGGAFIIGGAATLFSIFALSMKRIADLGLPKIAIIMLFIPVSTMLFVFFLACYDNKPDK